MSGHKSRRRISGASHIDISQFAYSKELYVYDSWYAPSSLAVDPTGSKMITAQSDDNLVREYNISNYDLSSPTYWTSKTLTAMSRIKGLRWNGDGTSLWVVGDTHYVRKYNINSNPYNISNVVDTVVEDIEISEASGSAIYSIDFNDDGSKAYVVLYNADKILQYSLSVPYEFSSRSYDGYLDTSLFASIVSSAHLITGGFDLLVGTHSGGQILQLGLTEKDNILTATLLNTLTYGSWVGTMIMNPDKNRMLVARYNDAAIAQFDL